MRFSLNYKSMIRQFSGSFYFALFWVAGLLTGFFLGIRFFDHDHALVYQCFLKDGSLIGLAFSGLLPVLISVVAVRFSLINIAAVYAYFKALSYGLLICCAAICFGSAGWLSRWLFLFTGTVGSLTYLWFWLSYSRCSKKQCSFRLKIYLAITVAGVFFERYFILLIKPKGLI